MARTLLGMLETIVEDIVQVQVVCQLRLADLCAGGYNHILLLFDTGHLGAETLKRERYAIHTALHGILPSLFEFVYDGRSRGHFVRMILIDVFVILFC